MTHFTVGASKERSSIQNAAESRPALFWGSQRSALKLVCRHMSNTVLLGGGAMDAGIGDPNKALGSLKDQCSGKIRMADQLQKRLLDLLLRVSPQTSCISQDC